MRPTNGAVACFICSVRLSGVNERVCSMGMARARSASHGSSFSRPTRSVSRNWVRSSNIAETHVLEFRRLKPAEAAQAAQEAGFSPRPGRYRHKHVPVSHLFSCIPVSWVLEEGNGWMKEVLLYLLILQERFAFSVRVWTPPGSSHERQV